MMLMTAMTGLAGAGARLAGRALAGAGRREPRDST